MPKRMHFLVTIENPGTVIFSTAKFTIEALLETVEECIGLFGFP